MQRNQLGALQERMINVDQMIQASLADYDKSVMASL
jgi:hypothetical protein